LTIKPGRPPAAPHKIPAWAWAWLRWRTSKHKPAPTPAPAFLTMFDSVTVSQIPKRAEAVAGYVGGHWPTFPELVKGWPHAHRLSIAVTAAEAADCLDVERGDASPPQAPGWLRSKATSHATPKPVLYTSVSLADALIKTMAAAGHPRSSYLLWTAHYTGRPHLCGPECSTHGVSFHGHADATQYADKALGRNLDASYVRAGFFRGA
jgi:hypothetical protein